MRKVYYFTCSKANRVMMSPSKWEFDESKAIRSHKWWFITVPNSFTMDFSTWVWTTRDKSEAEIIRNNKNYWSIIFETDEKWNDITKSIIDKQEWIEDAVIEVSNPYKSLPKWVISKMTLTELQDACKSINIEVNEEDSKKELIEKLVK